MSVMKDITNYNNISEGSRNARASDNIYVSFSTPRPDEQTRTPQSTRTRPLIRLLSEIPSNDVDLGSASLFEQEFGVLPSVLLTPTSPNDVKNLKFSTECCSSRPRKKLRLGNDETLNPIPLQKKLQSLSKPQLIELVNTLVSQRHPELEEEFYQLLPEPNLREMELKIKTLKRNIFKSFPRRGSHVGSTRDACTYRKASSHIQAFKEECISQVNSLVASCLWKSIVEYVLMAWPYVSDLPNWDSPAHNTSKACCFKTLAVHFQKAWTYGAFTIEESTNIRTRLKEACTVNKYLQPCLTKVDIFLKSQTQ